MNPLIYTPTGKAREYSPLALNHYRGCDHRCSYCYAHQSFGQPDIVSPRAGVIQKLKRELEEGPLPDKQVLLSFIGDPYCLANETLRLTTQVMEILLPLGIPVALLTKGGLRGLRDLDLIKGRNVKLGATLTFMDPARQLALDDKRGIPWEGGAACPEERLLMLKRAHECGIKTWASIEPVIDPEESLAIIRASLPYVDQYKVGRWNHDTRAHDIDWPKFAREAIDTIRAAGKQLYVKKDLRPALPLTGYITPQECDADALALTVQP
jgi:DNA repair photolyase